MSNVEQLKEIFKSVPDRGNTKIVVTQSKGKNDTTITVKATSNTKCYYCKGKKKRIEGYEYVLVAGTKDNYKRIEKTSPCYYCSGKGINKNTVDIAKLIFDQEDNLIDCK